MSSRYPFFMSFSCLKSALVVIVLRVVICSALMFLTLLLSTM